jgi:hypothetical protein
MTNEERLKDAVNVAALSGEKGGRGKTRERSVSQVD